MKDSIKGTPDSERTVVVRTREGTRVNAIVFITDSCARMDCWTGALQPGFYAFFIPLFGLLLFKFQSFLPLIACSIEIPKYSHITDQISDSVIYFKANIYYNKLQ